MKRESAKNIVIGFLMGVCLMLITAAAGSKRSPQQETGRYIISSGNERTYFIMDTRTGEHWYKIAERTGYKGDAKKWKAESK
ncbi:MAG: hypothetical protein ACYS32_11720 [Planctomycetota bacterium]|jgi:hypothetical protein